MSRDDLLEIATHPRVPAMTGKNYPNGNFGSLKRLDNRHRAGID
jgi:hypothetical protein